jgi:hypothetical protein
MQVLMVDVDGVIVSTPRGGWAVDIERDLGVTRAMLQQHFGWRGALWDGTGTLAEVLAAAR